MNVYFSISDVQYNDSRLWWRVYCNRLCMYVSQCLWAQTSKMIWIGNWIPVYRCFTLALKSLLGYFWMVITLHIISSVNWRLMSLNIKLNSSIYAYYIMSVIRALGVHFIVHILDSVTSLNDFADICNEFTKQFLTDDCLFAIG